MFTPSSTSVGNVHVLGSLIKASVATVCITTASTEDLTRQQIPLFILYISGLLALVQNKLYLIKLFLTYDSRHTVINSNDVFRVIELVAVYCLLSHKRVSYPSIEELASVFGIAQYIMKRIAYKQCPSFGFVAAIIQGLEYFFVWLVACRHTKNQPYCLGFLLIDYQLLSSAIHVISKRRCSTIVLGTQGIFFLAFFDLSAQIPAVEFSQEL